MFKSEMSQTNYEICINCVSNHFLHYYGFSDSLAPTFSVGKNFQENLNGTQINNYSFGNGFAVQMRYKQNPAILDSKIQGGDFSVYSDNKIYKYMI